MIDPTTTRASAIDPNTQRLIEQLALVINDTEQRLVAIKTALAQVLPQIAQGQQQPSMPMGGTMGHAPFNMGMQQPMPHLGAQMPPSVYGALPWQLLASQGLYPGVLIPGVNAPLGMIGAPHVPFRLW